MILYSNPNPILQIYRYTPNSKYLKMIDSHKIWEKGQNVFDLEQRAVVKELHRLLDVLLVLNNMTSCDLKNLNKEIDRMQRLKFKKH